ncbi:MAG: molecular chaperone TorD family protein [Syntrophobacteraceae bacterium]
MSRIEIPSPATYVPVARSFLYKSLSLGFAHPTRDTHAALRDGRFMHEVWDKLSLIAHLIDLLPERASSIRMVSESLASLSFEDFETSYTLDFERAVADATQSTAHTGQNERVSAAEIKKCYEGFGLTMNKMGILCTALDHLPSKLEFLHYLTLKEFQAGSHRNNAKTLEYLTAQKDFLECHLVSLLPLYLASFRRSPRIPAVYVELMRIASDFVRRDVEWVARRIEEESCSPRRTD